MKVEKEKLVKLNVDEKQLVLKDLKSLYDTTGQIFNWIQEDNLTEEMKSCLLNLIESYTSEISKILGYDSKATKEIEKRYFDIRKAHKEIDELKKKLSNNTQIDGLKELLNHIYRALDKWWELQGYNLVTDVSFSHYGFKGKFCLDTSYISYMATRPVTEKENKISKLEEMINDGYEFASCGGKEYILLDTDKNKELITAVIKNKFKSVEIIKWNNFYLRGTDKFQLREFECYIRDMQELKDLVDEMNQLDKERC